jgi:hypothetical protein
VFDDLDEDEAAPPKTSEFGRRPLLPLLDLEPRRTVASIMRGLAKPLPGHFVNVTARVQVSDDVEQDVELRVTSAQVGLGLDALAECPRCGERLTRILIVVAERPFLLCRWCRHGTYWSIRRGRRRPYKLVWRPLRQADKLRQRAAHTRNRERRQQLLRDAEERVLAAKAGARELGMRLLGQPVVSAASWGLGPSGNPSGARRWMP